MPDFENLRSKREEYAQELAELEETIEDEARPLTDEEQERFNDLKDNIEGIDNTLEQFDEANSIVEDNPTTSGPIGLEVDEDPKPSASPKDDSSAFHSLDHFVRDVLIFEKEGKRTNRFEKYAQKTETGSSGGYLVPDDFRDELLRVQPESQAIVPRATEYGSSQRNPDASVKVPKLDQEGSSAEDIYGGVDVKWTGDEDSKKSETSTTFLEDQLDPEEMAAFIDVTEKQLRNSGPHSDIFETLLQEKALAKEDQAFIQGDGVAKPKGIIGSSATVNINRDTSDQINVADLDNMMDGLLPNIDNNRLVWVASLSARSQITSLKDGERLYQRNIAEDVPDTLHGIPIFFSSRLPSLGNTGDLLLVAAEGYIYKRGFGPSIAISTDAEFKSAVATIRLVHNVDGMPWLNDSVTLEDGSTNVSHFIELDSST